MAAAKMRHFNSPEEVARRENQPAGSSKGKEFRHYNHPEEVARRAAAGKPSSVVAPPRRPRAPAPMLEGWPPAGEPNNAPAPAPVVVAATAVATNDKPDTVPPPAATGRNVERLNRLEALVHTFLEDEAEARHFRMLLNNVAALTEQQQPLVNRVRALELSLDQLLEEDDDVEPGAEASEPVTVDLGPKPPEAPKPEDS